MSVVITASGNFGPYKTIEVLADRLRCDDTELPLSVIGSYEISEDDSLAPVPPAPPEPIPSKVTRRQGIQQLLIEGVTEANVIEKINTLVPAGLQRELALIEFKESLDFEYDRPLTTMMAAAFGLDKAALFRAAAKR